MKMEEKKMAEKKKTECNCQESMVQYLMLNNEKMRGERNERTKDIKLL